MKGKGALEASIRLNKQEEEKPAPKADAIEAARDILAKTGDEEEEAEMADENNGSTTGLTGNVWTDVQAMHDKFGVNDHSITKRELWGRIQFLREELEETEAAFHSGDGEGILDGCLDLVVVAVGTLLLLSKGPEQPLIGWREVMRANMSKERGTMGKRPDMPVDLVKPEGWRRPDLSGIDDKALKVLAAEWEPETPPTTIGGTERGAAKVMRECMELFALKSEDYNHAESGVQTADYFPEGIKTFDYIVDTLKRLRQVSVTELLEHGAGGPNFDKLEEIIMDRIIYMAMEIEWLRRQTPGQDQSKDIFNR